MIFAKNSKFGLPKKFEAVRLPKWNFLAEPITLLNDISKNLVFHLLTYLSK